MIDHAAPSPDSVEALRVAMERASEALDFEKARSLRDQINLLRGGAATESAAHADTSVLTRQKPGAMGIGTNRVRLTPPANWQRPTKPNLRKPRNG